jgi:hypothetical protein
MAVDDIMPAQLQRTSQTLGEAAVLQDTDGVLTGGTRYPCLRVRQMDHKTTLWITHAALLRSVHLLFHSISPSSKTLELYQDVRHPLYVGWVFAF